MMEIPDGIDNVARMAELYGMADDKKEEIRQQEMQQRSLLLQAIDRAWQHATKLTAKWVLRHHLLDLRNGRSLDPHGWTWDNELVTQAYLSARFREQIVAEIYRGGDADASRFNVFVFVANLTDEETNQPVRNRWTAYVGGLAGWRRVFDPFDEMQLHIPHGMGEGWNSLVDRAIWYCLKENGSPLSFLYRLMGLVLIRYLRKKVLYRRTKQLLDEVSTDIVRYWNDHLLREPNRQMPDKSVLVSLLIKWASWRGGEDAALLICYGNHIATAYCSVSNKHPECPVHQLIFNYSEEILAAVRYELRKLARWLV